MIASVLSWNSGGQTSAHQRHSNVTWNADIEPIVERRCVGCHRTDGFAPMSFETYEQAKLWATAMKAQTLERRMPPWPATRGFGDFANDRSMTQLELELLASWVDGGLLEGQPGAAVSEPVKERPPDLIVRTAADAGRDGRALVSPPLDRDLWVRGWEFVPGNPSAVTSAAIYGASGDLLGSWVASEGAVVYPTGAALHLSANTRLSIDIRYRKMANDAAAENAVRLWVAKDAPNFLVRSRRLPCGQTRLADPVTVFSLMPWTSGAGTPIEVVARERGGRVDPLVVVDAYHPDYPINYRFRKTLEIASGSTLDVYSPESDRGCGTIISYLTRRR